MSELLSKSQIEEFTRAHPAWSAAELAIARTFKVKAHLEAHHLADIIGWHAEKVNHHPDLSIGYCKLVVTLTTHDSGGITTKDTGFAEWIDKTIGA
jgi:4a-hydroxytetrahydrobiopterin dehydratase